MKILPEDILAPKAVSVALLAILTIAVSVAWWMFTPFSLLFKIALLVAFAFTSFMVPRLLFLAKLTRMFEFTPALLAFYAQVGTSWICRSVTPVVFSLIILVSLLITSRLWKTDNPAREMFMISMLLSAGAVLSLPIVFLLPVMWLIFIMLQSFDFRTFLASLMGVACVMLLSSAVLYFLPDGLLYYVQQLKHSWQICTNDLFPLFGKGIVDMALVFALTMSAISVLNIIYHNSYAYRNDQYTRIQSATWGVLAVALALLFAVFGTMPILMPLTLITLLLLHHSTLMRPSWFIVVLWIICLLSILAVPLFSFI